MTDLTILQIGGEEFKKIIREAVNEALLNQSPLSNSHESPKLIKGYRNLALVLGISVSKLQVLKNQGKIPYFQDSRILLFDLIKVREALSNNQYQVINKICTKASKNK